MGCPNKKNTSDRPLPKGLVCFLTKVTKASRIKDFEVQDRGAVMETCLVKGPTTIPKGPMGALRTYTVSVREVVVRWDVM